MSTLVGLYLIFLFTNYAAQDWCEKGMPQQETQIEEVIGADW